MGVLVEQQGNRDLLSVPQLEKDGFVIDYNAKNRDWVVTTPTGERILFKKDTGLCEGMPYIDMREYQEAFGMVQTVRKQFKGFTRKEVKKAILAQKLQAMLGHPSDQELTQMVSRLNLWKSQIDVVGIPRDFYALHTFVTLVGDVMFVDGLPLC